MMLLSTCCNEVVSFTDIEGILTADTVLALLCTACKEGGIIWSRCSAWGECPRWWVGGGTPLLNGGGGLSFWASMLSVVPEICYFDCLRAPSKESKLTLTGCLMIGSISSDCYCVLPCDIKKLIIQPVVLKLKTVYFMKSI